MFILFVLVAFAFGLLIGAKYASSNASKVASTVAKVEAAAKADVAVVESDLKKL